MSKVTNKRVIKIEYWKSVKNNLWFGRIRGGNGRIGWKTSEGDGYERRAGVMNAINVLIRNGLKANVAEILDPNDFGNPDAGE